MDYLCVALSLRTCGGAAVAGGVADEDDSEAREADDRRDALPALIKRFIFGLARSPSSSGPTLVGSGSSGPITCV